MTDLLSTRSLIWRTRGVWLLQRLFGGQHAAGVSGGSIATAVTEITRQQRSARRCLLNPTTPWRTFPVPYTATPRTCITAGASLPCHTHTWARHTAAAALAEERARIFAHHERTFRRPRRAARQHHLITVTAPSASCHACCCHRSASRPACLTHLSSSTTFAPLTVPRLGILPRTLLFLPSARIISCYACTRWL